ncbi:hypothetical protein D3C76_493770 [compost metagenome]
MAMPLYFPYGISAEDALVRAALYLKCACDPQVVEHTNDVGRGFAWPTLHSVQMAKALIEALLDGIEARLLQTASQ